MSAKKALTRLLAGTKLKIRQVDDLGFIIKRPNVRTAQAGDEILLDGITVYGEKTERDLQETTSSVQVFTSDDIEQSTIQDLDDIFDQAANVTQGPNGQGFTIRGINNSSVTGFGFGPLSSVYIDGAVMSRFAVNTGIEELWDVEQVEIFRGPQSTTQGRNTLAGAVIINTKAPTYNFEAAARGGLANENSALFSGMVNIPLIKNMLAVRITADLQTTDGFNENVTLGIDDQAFEENKTIRGKILFEPNENITNTLTLTFSRNENGDNLVDRTRPFDRKFFGNIQGFEETDQYIATLDTEVRLNDKWSIRNIASFNRAKFNNFNDLDGSATGGNDPNDPNAFSRLNETDTFTEELRLHYKGEKLTGHIGAYFARIDDDDRTDPVTRFTDDQLVSVVGIPASLAPFYRGATIAQERKEKRLNKNYAAFGEASYDVNSFFTLFGGLRYDRDEFDRQTAENRSLVTALPDPATDCAIGGAAAIAGCTAVNVNINNGLTPSNTRSSTVSDAWLPSIGVTLNWDEDFATSFFVKRGYRSGGGGTSTITFTPFDFDPEFVWNYEFSLRSKWLDNKLTLNANVFYMDWTDQQVNERASNSTSDLTIVNAASSTLKGFEIEAFASPTENLKLRGSVGYVETEFKEFNSNRFGDLSGNEFPGAANWTIAGSARYTFNNGIYLHTDANYRSEAFVEVDNDPNNIQDARVIVNGKIGYKTDKLDAYIYSTNLFDEDYVEETLKGFPTALVGDGRTVGVRLNMKLD